jgi:arsenate reductase-like glutaredoxin family protein
MKIISLSSYHAGPACAVSVSIKKYFYNNNTITNIFDYLEISLESINTLISISPVDIDNFLLTNNNIYINYANYT